MIFYLGIHHVPWLETMTVPAFVSYSRLRGRKTFPRSAVDWGHDSRGFKEIETHGRYTFTAAQYAKDVRRASQEIGRMVWASIMDYMCEAHILKRTGLSVVKHQELTVQSLLELRDIAPDIDWAPVLQGDTPGSYEACAERYEKAGIALRDEPVVGLGSVCRRQSTREIAAVVRHLRPLNLRLHGFGVKATGIGMVGEWFHSFDSQAWSANARRRSPMEHHCSPARRDEVFHSRVLPTPKGKKAKTLPFYGHMSAQDIMALDTDDWTLNKITSVPVFRDGAPGWLGWDAMGLSPYFASHRNCANCLDYAIRWRETTVMPQMRAAAAKDATPDRQMALFGNAA